MEEIEVSVERVLEINGAVDTVGANDLLGGKTTYWLGRLGDFCNSIIKSFNKGREKILKEIRPQQEKLSKEIRETKDEAKKAELQEQIQNLNNDFQERVQAILDQKEKLKMPEFKLEEFMAKEDTQKKESIREGETTKEVMVTIKKGQSLVPVRFFKGMGEYVKE